MSCFSGSRARFHFDFDRPGSIPLPVSSGISPPVCWVHKRWRKAKYQLGQCVDTVKSTVRKFPEKFAWVLWREANLGCPSLASSPPTLVPLYRVRHRLAPPIAMTTSMFLGRIVPLVSLFVSGIWAQSDSVAQCEPGYEWVRADLSSFSDMSVESLLLNV